MSLDNKPEQLKTNKGISDLARKVGVSVSTVSQKLRRGKTEQQIADEAADWKAKQEIKKNRGAVSTNAKDESLYEAQRRKEIALANLRELELSIKRGDLVPVAEINAFVAGMVIEARNILLRIAPELRDRLAIETDPAEIDKLITTEVDRALYQLKEYKP